MKSHAHRPTRPDLWWVGLLLMIASAGLVVAAIWFGLTLFFSMGSDIQRALP